MSRIRGILLELLQDALLLGGATAVVVGFYGLSPSLGWIIAGLLSIGAGGYGWLVTRKGTG